MKVAQLVCGKMYEDRKGEVHRTLLAKSSDGTVLYRERYFTERCTIREFARWAARPAEIKKYTGQKFLNWLRGPTL